MLVIIPLFNLISISYYLLLSMLFELYGIIAKKKNFIILCYLNLSFLHRLLMQVMPSQAQAQAMLWRWLVKMQF